MEDILSLKFFLPFLRSSKPSKSDSRLTYTSLGTTNKLISLEAEIDKDSFSAEIDEPVNNVIGWCNFRSCGWGRSKKFRIWGINYRNNGIVGNLWCLIVLEGRMLETLGCIMDEGQDKASRIHTFIYFQVICLHPPSL
ncbi:unnamed protein product [Moneuplotes crassus]|uniref:Uncharacterized protein n=1 Tax=Euplotes crassus TaxID=5936 RepID=A0AAD1UJR2_EUPCR|nr:unnamed protein product [Moneuplotes crassus]